jgi:catechol 1,2-dioxygenase
MDFVDTQEVQDLLDRASGLSEEQGNARFKAIVRDLLQALMQAIDRHAVTDQEFWSALKFLGDAVGEWGLMAPGLGIEHFLDLRADRDDRADGVEIGTPRTIEGPLFIEGAPFAESDTNITTDPDEGEHLLVDGSVCDTDGNPVPDAVVHVWHANSKGFYSHFDPTARQSPFNNRRRLRLGSDSRYAFRSVMPKGYSVPPGGPTEQLMNALGRDGSRPAHVHFMIEAPNHRTLTTQLNFGDDPLAHDDFAFGTRKGLLPIPDRSGDGAHISFDFVLVPARSANESGLPVRPRELA